MKTTMDIADPLLREAKRVAAERGMTLRALVEEALRAALDEPRRPRGRARLRVRTFRGEGLQPGVAWGDWDAWRALAYEGRGG